MAARIKRRFLDDEWRQKIQTSMLVKRLSDNAAGNLYPELSPSQVRSIEILLKKVAPDLSAVEHTGEVTQNYVMLAPAVEATADEWASRYQPTH